MTRLLKRYRSDERQDDKYIYKNGVNGTNGDYGKCG